MAPVVAVIELGGRVVDLASVVVVIRLEGVGPAAKISEVL